MLLLEDAALDDRRRAIRGPLAPLYDSLAAELEPVLRRDVYVPESKALLSRAGGRCERDGTPLTFDPTSPHTHACPTCGQRYGGEWHHRAWVTSYQLWLAERAVHAALCFLLGGETRHGQFAAAVLRAYADRYMAYPNRDNVLGPTRLFFSTYLESVWLLQVCIAADALAHAGDAATADVVRERIARPSGRLIAGYDEGMSNRQVWNNAAMFAAAALCGDDGECARLVSAASGITTHLSRGLLDDGTWYEGENYHQFALRGLWYGVTLCESRGLPTPEALRARFDRAFLTLFLTALPDFTMVSRKDSQYGVALRQWRVAELAELGFARSRDARLGAALARCYEAGHERRDTGRARSTADIERNGPPSALTRADLGWRALLHALPQLPPLVPVSPRSTMLEAQGYAVFRREPDVYVGVDFGQSGGGHGHRDRLNVTLYQGATRWLDDMGTGSYVDPTLHWFRSTLAHNAPLVNGRSQPMRDGVLRAYDEREGLGWLLAELDVPDAGVRIERAVVVAPGYLIDELSWDAERDIRLELPWHLDALPNAKFRPAPLDGGAGTEDGFAFVDAAEAAPHPAGAPLVMRAVRDGMRTTATLFADAPATVFRGRAPGQPPGTFRRFTLVRVESRRATLRTVITWTGATVRAEDGATLVQDADGGGRHRHWRDAAGWHVELHAGDARSSIDLAGFRPAPDGAHSPVPIAAPRTPVPLRRRPLSAKWFSDLSEAERRDAATFELGESEYRRSEDSWDDAGRPRASVALAADGERLVMLLHVRAGDPHFVPADTPNPYDNESADTMGAGIQLYLRTPHAAGAWLLVPAGDGAVRARPVADWLSPASIAPVARWRPVGEGYEVRVEVPLPESAAGREYPVEVDVIVNETRADRTRRRGQLVLTGARGEFVYLRGDRHDATRLLPLVIVS